MAEWTNKNYIGPLKKEEIIFTFFSLHFAVKISQIHFQIVFFQVTTSSNDIHILEEHLSDYEKAIRIDFNYWKVLKISTKKKITVTNTKKLSSADMCLKRVRAQYAAKRFCFQWKILDSGQIYGSTLLHKIVWWATNPNLIVFKF